MTKTSRNLSAAAEESFHKHYAAIWTEERWNAFLYPALAEPTRYTALVNQYTSESASFNDIHGHFDPSQLERVVFPPLETHNTSERSDELLCYVTRSRRQEPLNETRSERTNSFLPPPKPVGASRKLITHWNLDAASALAAHLLSIQPGDNVLDLCAAPGGKSIALAQNIWPQLHDPKQRGTSSAELKQLGHLTSNELDPSRYKRLTENLKAYLPSHLFNQKQVSTLRIDCTDPLAARKLSIGSAGYDKVLVDAPCSSERHIIHAHIAAQAAGRVAPEMANWRPGSSKRLAKTQVDLLMTGLRAARIGGSILYATCSIEMAENDGVVEKVQALVQKERKKGALSWSFKIGFNVGDGDEQLEAELEHKWAQRTRYGWIVLPDHPSRHGWGPLFFVVLTKVEAPG